VSLRLRQKGIATVSLDISSLMVTKVREKTAQAGVPSLCTQGDIERLPFRDESFGAVVCTGVLHHLMDACSVLPELLRVLRRGGWLFISEPCRTTPWLSVPYSFSLELFKPLARPLRGLPSCWAERPLTALDVERMTSVLETYGATHTLRFLVYWPFVNERLNPRLAAALTAFLNQLNGRASRGDVVNIVAQKTASPESRRPILNNKEACRVH
jgi:SAM-dependent methyltransferase